MMRHALPRLVGCSALLLLAACAGGPDKPWKAGATTEEPKPISIELLKLEHAVKFPATGGAPSPGELAGLETFLDQSEAHAGDFALVEAPDGPFSEPRTAVVVARLAARGLRAKVGRGAPVQSGAVTVILERYVASVPKCPDWSLNEWSNFANHTSSNLGCSTALDLAAMVADPRDLAVGRTIGPQVGEPASRAVRAYREGIVNSAGSATQQALPAAGGAGP